MTNYDFHLDKALNFPGAGKLIAEKGISALNEELRKRGESAKQQSADAKQPDGAANTEAAKDWTPTLDELLEVAGTHQKALDDADKAHADYVKATDAKVKALEEANAKALKRLDEAEKALKAIKEDTPRRASEASETKLSEAEEKAAKEKIEKRTVEYDPAFPGMNVPLKTNS